MLLNFRRPARLLPALLALVFTASAASAEIRYVDANLASGANDGTSWANAFQGSDGLRLALDAAVAGDQVFAAQGTYLPTQTLSRTVAFAMKNGVEIYGSFLGTESSPSGRPPFGTAPSILDGDLLGNDGAGAIADNSFHVVTTTGTNSSALLDGFVVARGHANGAAANQDRGAGILCIGGVSPRIQNCRFLANRTTFGGAAGYINTGAAPTFTDCSFEGGFGGSFGGAFDIAGGGAVRFERCRFIGNTAARAGALEIFSTTGVVVSNSLFVGNTSTGTGGGGAVWVGSGGNPRFVGCTIANNNSTVNAVAGLRNQGATGTTVVNCVIWNNAGPSGATNAANQINTGTNVTYSIVQGGYAGTGNGVADPRFTNAVGGDFAPALGSPCIDRGNTGAVPAGSTTDLAGSVRLVDEPATFDGGAGSAPIVDIGAFEVPASDFTAVAGCFGNPVGLGPISASFAVGQPFGLRLTASAFPVGLGVLFVGADGTDAFGCGLLLPGLGEVLLTLAPGPIVLASAGTAGGTSEFALALPPNPALAGVDVAFQGINIAVTTPGAPIELSHLVRATVAP